MGSGVRLQHTGVWTQGETVGATDGSFKAHGVTGGPGGTWGRRLGLGRRAGEERS